MSYLAQYKLLPRELMTVLGVIAKVIVLPSGLLVLWIISSRRQPARGEWLCWTGPIQGLILSRARSILGKLSGHHENCWPFVYQQASWRWCWVYGSLDWITTHQLQTVVPGESILPKMHFMLHMPRLTLKHEFNQSNYLKCARGF